MGKILVIEPYRMLQQAISTALFPDHEVQIMESLHVETPHAPDIDLIILDAASLRAKNVLGSPLPQWIQDGSIPVVWVDNEDPTGAAKRGHLTLVQSPLTKDGLLAAVAHSLRLLSKPNDNGSLTDAAKGRPLDAVAVPGDAQVIELVDAVNEEPESKKSESDGEQ